MRWLLLALLVWFSGCRHVSVWEKDHPPLNGTERELPTGQVRGFLEDDGTHAWLGVPYAKPPVGPLRWKPPESTRWTGVRDSTRFGQPCIQLGGPASDTPVGGVVGSEDCLTLNVWTPAFAPNLVPQGDLRLPVMVWIHGGGNTVGTSGTYAMLKNLAASHRVVVVSVNYRLGIMGWFHHPSLISGQASALERSGNWGTLDLIESLRWVKASISAFGGNPDNVTVFGESAGGINVYSLLASPLTTGLFHRAIAQSPVPVSMTLAQASNYTDDAEPGFQGSSAEVLAQLLVKKGLAVGRGDAKQKVSALDETTRAALLRGATPAELLSLFKDAVFSMYRSPNILRDGAVFPDATIPELFEQGKLQQVPLLLGTNRDEFKLFLAFDPNFVSWWFGRLPKVKDHARFALTTRYLSDVWTAAAVHELAPKLRAHNEKVFAYRFDWDHAPKRLGVDLGELFGAAHATELPFVFLNTDRDDNPFPLFSEENRGGARALSEAMASYWVEFARHGSPGRGLTGNLPEWKAWSLAPNAPQFMVLDAPQAGGVRMSDGALTLRSVKARLAADPVLDSKPEDRCRLHSVMFHDFVGEKDDDYLEFANGLCKAYPREKFRTALSR